jgi:hypothetical protein
VIGKGKEKAMNPADDNQMAAALERVHIAYANLTKAQAEAANAQMEINYMFGAL